jgi:cell division septum initiation protein DivIVA
MPGMEWIFELALSGLLIATLFHALRLERALGVLKRDRGALELLVAGFNASTFQAETSVARLRQAAEGAGRDIAHRIDAGTTLKDDLAFLIERGDRLADRLESLVRQARPLPTPAPAMAETYEAEPRVRSQAERDLLQALRMAR